MIEKTMNGWKIHEEPEGLTFKQVCLWDTLPAHCATDKLNNYIIRGIFENDGDLFLMLVKNGCYRLMRISTGEEGNHIIDVLQLGHEDFRYIYKLYCEQDEPKQNSKQIIE